MNSNSFQLVPNLEFDIGNSNVLKFLEKWHPGLLIKILNIGLLKLELVFLSLLFQIGKKMYIVVPKCFIKKHFHIKK